MHPRVRNIDRVEYDSAESYPTRPPPIQLGGPSRPKIAESTRVGPDPGRLGARDESPLKALRERERDQI